MKILHITFRQTAHLFQKAFYERSAISFWTKLIPDLSLPLLTKRFYFRPDLLCHISTGPNNVKIRLGQDAGYGDDLNNLNDLSGFCINGRFNIGKNGGHLYTYFASFTLLVIWRNLPLNLTICVLFGIHYHQESFHFCFVVGDANGDRMDDLICVHDTGAVNVALASFTGSNKFVAEAWKDDDFGFCTDTNAKVSSLFSMSSDLPILQNDMRGILPH